MPSAVYYPFTNVQSEEMLKHALLLWDEFQTIVPVGDHAPHAGHEHDMIDRRILEEARVVLQPRRPREGDKDKAHEALKPLVESGVVRRLIDESDIMLRGMAHYDIYMDKFGQQTWDMLREADLLLDSEHIGDHRVRLALGLLMMSLLADACAGTRYAVATDQEWAYAWLATKMEEMTGTKFIPFRENHGIAEAHAVLARIAVAVPDPDGVPVERLLAMRIREANSSRSYEYAAIRERYHKGVERYIKDLTKPGLTPDDLRDIERSFEREMQDDFNQLRGELQGGFISCVNKVGVKCVLLAKGLGLLAPESSLLNAAILGILPIAKEVHDLSKAEKAAARKHTMSWLYLANNSRPAMLKPLF